MNVVIGQSGGPTSVINSSLAGAYEGAIRAGANKVYGMRNGIFGLMNENLVLLNDLLGGEGSFEIIEDEPEIPDDPDDPDEPELPEDPVPEVIEKEDFPFA